MDTAFNANEVEPNTEFTPAPAGKYLAVITASEFKPNKAGTGVLVHRMFYEVYWCQARPERRAEFAK